MSHPVIIDNYDSFTYNIRDVLGSLGHVATVVRNDEVTIEQLAALRPTHLILGPGPGSPDYPADVGISFDVIDYATREGIPLLGICLGQQIIAKHLGGRIVRAPEVMHGKASIVSLPHPQLPHPDLFSGCGSSVTVMRYHSLICERATRHADLIPTGTTAFGDAQLDMAFQHATLPVYAVQFHPESFFTEHGTRMLGNFMAVPSPISSSAPATDTASAGTKLPEAIERMLAGVMAARRPSVVREFQSDLPPEAVYERFDGDPHCFCFESLDPENKPYRVGGDTGRYSYFGRAPLFTVSARNDSLFIDDVQIDIGSVSPLDALDAMQRRLAGITGEVAPGQLLRCGLVGFFAYEAMQYREPSAFPGSTPDDEKTFAFGYFDDVLLYDRARGMYLYCSCGRDRFDEFCAILSAPNSPSAAPVIRQMFAGMSQDDFENGVRTIIESEINAGNSQQVILSRRKSYRIDGSLAPVYREYRRLFPSPNMHALRMGDMESVGSFAELMMRADGNQVTTIQLAGTRRRAGDAVADAALFAELKSHPKECAEHRMLIDLARNDLGRSCVPGSVTVRDNELMVRRDAGPVMHIATTVRGTLDPHLSPVYAHANLSPMGTVSGSPKIRACQIVHAAEAGKPRGMYAGSFGFFDASGNAEFVIGLRNVFRTGKQLHVQAGAGVVRDSDPQGEYAETENKMKAALSAIEPFIATAKIPASSRS